MQRFVYKSIYAVSWPDILFTLGVSSTNPCELKKSMFDIRGNRSGSCLSLASMNAHLGARFIISVLDSRFSASFCINLKRWLSHGTIDNSSVAQYGHGLTNIRPSG